MKLLVRIALLVALAGPAAGEDDRREKASADPIPAGDTSSPSELALVPAFPGARALRFRFDFETLPAAGLEQGSDVSVSAPGLGLRAAVPLNSRAALQLVARYSASLYDFDGAPDFFALGTRQSRPFDDLHDLRLNLQGAYELNRERHLFFEGERWSLLGEIFGGARWEEGAFDDALFGGGGLALGYELSRWLRLAVGVAVRTRIAASGVGLSPVVSVRLRPTERLTLRTRGRGGQIEYEWSRALTVYGTVFETGQGWRLDRRSGVPDRILFNDTQLRCGVGAEWRAHRQLRVQFEIGAVARRELEVEARGVAGGTTLARIEGDPSAYLGLSLEFRP